MIQSQQPFSKFQKRMQNMKGFLNSQSTLAQDPEPPVRKTQTPIIGQSHITSIELSDPESSSSSLDHKQLGIKSRNFHEEYVLGPKLGEGTHGIVRLCWKKDLEHEKYAVKLIPTPDEELLAMVRSTFLNTTIVKSPYIAKSQKLYIDQDMIYMLMEYVPHQNLEDILRQHKKLKEHQVQRIALCLLKAIRSLHSAGICHRDIKPDNIQINQADFSVKLIDFGVSRRYVTYNSSTFRYNRQNMLTVTGNIHYRAPEIYGGHGYGYDQQIDIWAVGVVVYQSLTGKLPITGNSVLEILDVLTRKEAYTQHFNHPEFLSLTPSCRDFLKRLMMWNPLKRLNASQALKHIWIPYNVTPQKPLFQQDTVRKKAKDDIDASKISQNSDILNRSLINSAMILNQELQNTLIRSRQFDVIKEEDGTPIQTVRQSLELSIRLGPEKQEESDFRQRLKQFKLEASQRIHQQQAQKASIKLIDTIRQVELEDALFKNVQMETSLEIPMCKEKQVDLFGLNLCESQSSLTNLDEILAHPLVVSGEGPNKKLDKELLEQLHKFNI